MEPEAGAGRDAPAAMGEMRLATKDHIDHIDHDGEMYWKKRRLTGTVRPTFGPGLLWVGMSVPAHPRGSWGLACVWAIEDGSKRRLTGTVRLNLGMGCFG